VSNAREQAERHIGQGREIVARQGNSLSDCSV